ncbi:MAG: polyamine ABC transporter ATP-binding protein [Halofilum sp. (in: g-proteobacteria)]|nr:polyamine ABC transporter ATP-binding protein [Halofilum sp. (in: g-proteobacteria)]
MTDSTDGTIQLVDIVKRFGSHTAVDGISMDIPGGEFFSMLGPSGCGKTTTLRMIAGFEKPDEGHIMLRGQNMEHEPPHRRPVNTVFQNYALFPHLNVFDNVAFGLRRARIGKDEVRRRAGEALELVMLDGLGERKPSELSGGQQQRVALARALVLKPAGLLLDEPLGALDAKLRRQLQIELKALQEQVGITFIYVTHDQDEALTMSDRIAVMNEGQVEQMGSPREIYEAPETTFVADFLGASNLMDCTARGSDGEGRCRVNVGGTELVAALERSSASGPGKVTIRPERVRLEAPDRLGLRGQPRRRPRRALDLHRQRVPAHRAARQRQRDRGRDPEHRRAGRVRGRQPRVRAPARGRAAGAAQRAPPGLGRARGRLERARRHPDRATRARGGIRAARAPGGDVGHRVMARRPEGAVAIQEGACHFPMPFWIATAGAAGLAMTSGDGYGRAPSTDADALPRRGVSTEGVGAFPPKA